MNGLSKREKLLILAAAALLLIFVSFRFLVMPIYTDYRLKSEEYQQLAHEKMMMDIKLQNEIGTRENYARVKNTYEEIKKLYPPPISNEEVDRILTSMCLENGLKPVRLGISGQHHDANSQAAFSITSATMALSGDYDSLKRLVRAVEDVDYIRLSRVNFTQDINLTASANISANFEITMLK